MDDLALTANYRSRNYSTDLYITRSTSVWSVQTDTGECVGVGAGLWWREREREREGGEREGEGK